MRRGFSSRASRGPEECPCRWILASRRGGITARAPRRSNASYTDRRSYAPSYLLQAHESKLMIDIIARRILAEMPGTFVGTIHDSIMTTPERAEAVRGVMVEEFGRFGLSPTIRLESYR